MSKKITHHWSNSSVLAFSAGNEPLNQARAVAAELLEVARQGGHAGPPVDVFGLAGELGIQLRPKDDLLDARIIVESTNAFKKLVIEFNPSRPRGRLRFSIAHEIAHSRFPDFETRPRHRTASGSVAESSQDDWELELVCDVIAAELLIPGHAVEGLLTVDPDIDYIMETRRRVDVSTEALLRRLVEATPRSLTMLAASRPTHGPSGAMRVDYAARSAATNESGALAKLGHGDLVRGLDPLLKCAAVGQTVRDTVVLNGERLYVQCVGVPPYPGSQWPRVLALIEAEDDRIAMPGYAFVVSDLVDVPDGDAQVIFAHVVSDSVRTWNHVGAAGSLAKAFPDFAQAFRSWTLASPNNLRLGTLHFVEQRFGERVVGVASLIAQAGFGGGGPRLRCDALEDALVRLADLAKVRRAEVHVPRLGTGRAGGRWDEVERLLIAYLVAEGVPVTVHTLPITAHAARTTNG